MTDIVEAKEIDGVLYVKAEVIHQRDKKIEWLREALRLSNELVDELAHTLTGLCNSVCCHRSGVSHKEENCECRAVAAEIVEFFQARAALEEKE